MSPAIREAYVTAVDMAGADPIGIHSGGRRAQSLLQAARESIAASIGVSATEVRFTANLSTALHTVIGALMRGQARRGDTAVLTAVERAAAFNGVDFHARQRAVVPVDPTGLVAAEAWEREVGRDGAAMAVAQHANQESGIGQGLDALHETTRSVGVPLLVDASMTLGRAPLPQSWDALVADGRSLGAPVSLGIMVVRHATRWLPAWPEDASSWQPGGVDVAAAFAVAAALEERLTAGPAEWQRQRDLIARLTSVIEARPESGVAVVGGAGQRLAPHVVCLSLSDVDGELLATELDRRGIAVGAGSACASTALEPSHVLRAMGVQSAGSIRLSVDDLTTTTDIDAFLTALPDALASVRTLLSP